METSTNVLQEGGRGGCLIAPGTPSDSASALEGVEGPTFATTRVSDSESSQHQDSALRELLDYSHDDSTNCEEYGCDYGYEPMNIPPPPMDFSMTPERQARKQRSRPSYTRRGGACHSELLKSAVLATLESYDSGGEEVEYGLNRTSSIGGMDRSERSMPMDDNSRSSRKRARQTNGANDEDDGENLIDDCLLGAMDVCTISSSSLSSSPLSRAGAAPAALAPAQAQPVRHVVRRTSRELAYARRTKEEQHQQQHQNHLSYDRVAAGSD